MNAKKKQIFFIKLAKYIYKWFQEILLNLIYIECRKILRDCEQKQYHKAEQSLRTLQISDKKIFDEVEFYELVYNASHDIPELKRDLLTFF